MSQQPVERHSPQQSLPEGGTLSPDEKLGFKHQRANRCQKRQSHWEQEGEGVQSWGLGLSDHYRSAYPILIHHGLQQQPQWAKMPKIHLKHHLWKQKVPSRRFTVGLCTRHTDKTSSYTSNARQTAGSFPGSVALFCG